MRRGQNVFNAAVLALALLSSLAMRGQEIPAVQSQTATRPVSASKVEAGRLRLDVVVTDAAGRTVSGLDPKDFTLLDNGQPSPILSFHAFDDAKQRPHPPVEVILVLDTVNETHQQVAFVRQEIAKYLRQNGGHLAQPVSLFVLTNDGVDAQRLPSTDGNVLAAKIDHIDDRLRTIGRAGGSWGAIERFQLSVKTMLDIADAEAKKPGRKLLIWTSSGWPLLDSPHIQTSFDGQKQSFDVIVKLSTRLREARISAYSITYGMPVLGTYLYKDFLAGVKTAQKASPSNLGLKVLAVQSGGRVLSPDNDLTAKIDNCVTDANAFYTLSFDPPKAAAANEFHDLKVVVNKPGVTARTNTSYYNQP